jgi:hypothetical protein
MSAVDLNIVLGSGVRHQRRAVTRRASTILASELLVRKQAVANSGQTCLEQFRETGRTSSRSAFASATASLAFAVGAKLGNAITETPSTAKIAKAAKDLIIGGC